MVGHFKWKWGAMSLIHNSLHQLSFIWVGRYDRSILIVRPVDCVRVWRLM